MVMNFPVTESQPDFMIITLHVEALKFENMFVYTLEFLRFFACSHLDIYFGAVKCIRYLHV